RRGAPRRERDLVARGQAAGARRAGPDGGRRRDPNHGRRSLCGAPLRPLPHAGHRRRPRPLPRSLAPPERRLEARVQGRGVAQEEEEEDGEGERVKGHRGTIALLLIAVALGLFLWFDRNKVTESERQRRENNVFVAWRREDLSRIEIAHEGETIVLV